MKERTKNILAAVAIIAAILIVGHMDYQDEKCSWNGCGEERFETKE